MVAGSVVLLCLALASIFAFSQGKAYAEKKAAMQVANDDAFYSLYALRSSHQLRWVGWTDAADSGIYFAANSRGMAAIGLISMSR